MMIIRPRIRGFLCTTAHPTGCAADVVEQIAYVQQVAPIASGPKRVLIIGASGGYGLASRITAAFGSEAATVGVFFERPATGNRTASPGWYKSAAFTRLSTAQGLYARNINGDAFSADIKQRTCDLIRNDLGQVDMVVYSLAAPSRQLANGELVRSALKPIGTPFIGKSIDLRSGEVREGTIEPATVEEIEGTVRVMGGDDWSAWIDELREAGLLAPGARTLAYSYVGGALTQSIYRDGTIGRAKEHLEETAHRLSKDLSEHCGGGAWVSLNKAVVTQASAAIPAFSLYASILFRVMKDHGTHEGVSEQIVRLFCERLPTAVDSAVDVEGRIRLDDLEMDPIVQARVADIWQQVDTANLEELSDYAGYRSDFEQLFGFGVEGVDYSVPTEIDRPLVLAKER